MDNRQTMQLATEMLSLKGLPEAKELSDAIEILLTTTRKDFPPDRAEFLLEAIDRLWDGWPIDVFNCKGTSSVPSDGYAEWFRHDHVKQDNRLKRALSGLQVIALAVDKYLIPSKIKDDAMEELKQLRNIFLRTL